VLAAAALVGGGGTATAAPAPPSGGHPRLFLSTSVKAALVTAATQSDSAMAALIKECETAGTKPTAGSGYMGQDWSYDASACAIAWQITGTAAYAATGIKLWKQLLEDIETPGDKMACVAGADEMTATASIRRDDDYAIRYIGPHTALVYDWLHDAPGVTEAFRQQTRDCFRNWITFYTREGYLNDQAGANYNAGYVAAKTLIAIAEAGEDGASSDKFWADDVDTVFNQLLIQNGLAGDNGGVPQGGFHGSLVGGDWPEGWQYGPQSITEYAFSARALNEQGVDLGPFGGWASDSTLRGLYALLPDKSGQYIGGDTDDSTFFTHLLTSPFDVGLMLGSDQAAGWAAFTLADLFDTRSSVWHAIADSRTVTPADPLATNLPPWYLARGTRNLYARSDWTAGAYWSVFTSAPRLVDDHQHMDASNFVFVRGGDPLIVDPSPYGSRSSLTGNAITIDTDVVHGDYKPSQTEWSLADLPLARGTASGVVAARSDFARAFDYNGTPSDIPFAHRDFVFLPEGEVVTVDRVTTPSATKLAYLRFRTPGTLSMVTSNPLVVRAPSGGSALAIHAVALKPDTPPILRAAPDGTDCGDQRGACRFSRLPTQEYVWEVPGPDVLAIHVFDGLAANDPVADVAPIDAPPIDASPAENSGAVIGASVFRSMKQTFVVEPATLPAPATLVYSVPGANPSRHVVFDAPADTMDRTTVTATVEGDRCKVTLTAGAGVTGRPAIFTLATAANGCTVSEDADVPPGSVSPGTGGFMKPAGAGGKGGGGCSCRAAGASPAAGGWIALVAAALGIAARNRRRRPTR